MEALLINDRSLSQSKQIKNSMEKPHYYAQYHTQHHVTRQPSNNIRRQASYGIMHQKYAPSPNVQLEMVQAALATGGGGVFLNHYPPRRQFSLNSSLPPILPTHLQPHYYQQQKKMNHQQHQQQQQQQQQPPLLPLPSVSKPAFRSLPPSPFPRKKPNKTKLTTTTKTSTTSRKPAQNIKKENKVVVMVDEDTKREEDDQVVVVRPAKEKEPDPVSPPKGSMTRVLREADLNNNINRTNSEITKVPSLFFNFMSPPPSSLPLPKFTMRQNKLSCNAEAAATDGVDSGATNNLRRMLKLR